jgi:hypothetical protein
MTRSRMSWMGGIALAMCAVTSASCINLAGQSCTLTAPVCEQTTIILQAPSDAWTAGMYTLALTIDGTPAQCTLQIPDPPPVGAVQGSCGLSTVTFSLTTVDSCPPVVCSNGACEGMSCTPIPGRFQTTLKIGTGFGSTVSDAQPHVVGQLGLNLSLDGNNLLNETIAPKQTTTEPNGAGCGTCTNASATLSIAGGD